jgi:hypothetical protein
MFGFKKSQQQMILVAVFLSLVIFSACGDGGQKKMNEANQPNILTKAEKADGWILLFDGQSFKGWHGLGREEFPSELWKIEDGSIKRASKSELPPMQEGQPGPGGDIISDQTWQDFELTFEWKISSGSNSGVKYNVSEELSMSRGSGHSALGWEYQVLDDANHEGDLNGNQLSGALYDMFAPVVKVVKPAGEWNTAKIAFIGKHGEHWLNGEKVVEYDMDTPRFEKAFDASKFAKIPGFREKKNGHIVLQDHGGAVWYRNIKIKPVVSEY